MSGPKFRFTIVVGFLLTLWWGWDIVSTYFIGERGLNIPRYGYGVMQLGFAAAAGFGVVWLAMWLAARAQQGKTGFEAEIVDEYGTTFRMGGGAGLRPFPMQLSKFLPEIIAAPTWPGLSQLESEMLGFLNGYRHWPASLEQGTESLYERSLSRWVVMRDLPGASDWHRIMALAADMGKIYAYREVRGISPIRQFWKRDRVRFERRTREHGGLAAFVLSTLPGFRTLSLQQPDVTAVPRRALLTALRYMDDPRLLPVSTSTNEALQQQAALSREYLNYWQRAEAMLAAQRGQIQEPTTQEQAALTSILRQYFADLFDGLNIPETPADDSDAVLLPQARLLLRPSVLLANLAQNMPSQLRQRFQLWDGAGALHPVWPLVVEQLQQMGVWAGGEGQPEQPQTGRTYLLADTSFGPAIELDLSGQPGVQQRLTDAPVWHGSYHAQLNTEDVKLLMTSRSDRLSQQLDKHF